MTALVEQVAKAMVLASGKDPDKTTAAPRGVSGIAYLWQSYEHLAQAAIASVIAHATSAGSIERAMKTAKRVHCIEMMGEEIETILAAALTEGQ